ncbi:type II and III secretion system protein family protein [Erythrobacter sp. YT30]|uniref:type II and III secretion system protein family protein n=1 Tax=Erythrobacter sp. YT30 TaxID=1735012 RepID=UPI0009EC940C|nr:type II and III secretion system protein family protein [Erythrobacter sp. YT30]
MKRQLTSKMLMASLAVAPLAVMPTSTATAQQVVRPAQDIVLSIGKGELVTVPGAMADVFVANDSVADVQIKSQRQLYVFGRAGGETTIYASNARGDVIFSANIRVGSNIDSIDQMLALAMPEAKVSVATMGSNTVLLTGTVAAPEDASEAERLVQAFLGDGVNVITRVKTATPLQVNLKVTFAEVSRSLVRAIGANLTTADSTDGFQFGIGTGRGALTQYTPGGPAGVNVTAGAEGTSVITTAGTTVAGLGQLFGLDLAGTLDLSETIGLVNTISEPNLTALSGETATFLAGGEFPIPISQGLGNVAVEFRQFGVSLAYTPTVLSNGRISLRLRPEVSELSSSGSVTLNGFEIPSLTTRRTETTVELGSGQSFMIAGLMSNNSQNSLEKTPGLGDVPILGNLFRSRSYRKGETELVIIATPYLVKPVSARDIKLPTDGFHAANEIDQLLLYKNNKGVSGEERPGPTAVGQDAPNPSTTVGSADPAAIVPSNAAKKPRRSENKRKKDRQADAAKPGFSL